MSPAELRAAVAAPGPAEGFTSRYVSVRGQRLHVRERAGSGPGGPPWVLLHGLAVSHRYLMPTAAALPGRVYVPDLPGFGLSQPPRPVYDTAEHTNVVAAWMDAQGLSGAYLVSNSFGCQIAVEMAVRRPDLVALLVLVGPTVDPAAPTATGQALRWARDLLREDPRQIRIIAADVRDAGLWRILRTLRHSARHRIEQRLPLVAAPVLVMRGERDPIVPPRWAVQAAGLAPTGRTETVPRAAHNAMTTAGSFIAERVVAFAATAARIAAPRAGMPPCGGAPWMRRPPSGPV